jgi:hypothetical protein
MSNQANVQVSVRSADRLAEPSTSYSTEELPLQVVVTDFQMPFWSMAWFMVKWALASIPALAILLLFARGMWFIYLAASQ